MEHLQIDLVAQTLNGFPELFLRHCYWVFHDVVFGDVRRVEEGVGVDGEQAGHDGRRRERLEHLRLPLSKP